jgi:uncharacterized membrane protein (UPF0127 family)
MKPFHLFSLSGFLACCFAFSSALSTSTQAQPAPQRLPTTNFSVGIHVIHAEIAETPEQRSVGLMNRTALGVNDGMLFVFQQAAVQCFWMKNTLIPLTIAFIDDSGLILQLDDMQPQTLDEHCSTKPVRFALEVNEHWFVKRNLKPGTRLQGLPFQYSMPL